LCAAGIGRGPALAMSPERWRENSRSIQRRIVVNVARMKTVGVLGLGIIGGVYARHYHAAGVLAGAWNRTPQPGFPRWQDAPEAVAAAAEVTHIVVADPPAVRGVLERILPALGPGKVVVQSSTIDPASSDEFLQTVTARGARYLEAPFTGSKPAAEQRQTVFYLGGDAALIAELEPVLNLISATRFHIGAHRQACALKLAMNLNISAQMQALSEALTIARKAGVSDDVFFNVVAKNVSYSGLAKLKEPKLRTNDFSPQFSVKHMLKDMRLASAMNGCADLPVLDTVRECLAAAARAGYADEDFAALIKVVGTS
jgi:3-hydroxyisobutyrate dehydrogenase